MNEDNYRDITQKYLPKLGFGGVLDEQILTLMKTGGGVFIAKAIDTVNHDKVQYELKFGKNEKNEKDPNYYLNTISVTRTLSDGNSLKHEFNYFFGNGFNAEQINNIMEGRSVYTQFKGKNHEEHRMWYAIDPNKKYEKGFNIKNPSFEKTTNFNLVIEVSKFTIPGQSAEDKNRMLYELRNGNEYLTNIKMPDGSTPRVTLVAQPHVNQVAAYDMDGNRIKLAKATMQAIPMNTKPQNDISANTAAVMNKEEGKTTGAQKSQSA